MKKLLVVIFLIVVVNSLHASDNIRFFWSFGDIGFSFEGKEKYMELFPSMNVGSFNWITDFGLGWGFHTFSIESSSNWTQALILPVEISYSPFGDNSKQLFLTLYGRGGWMLNADTNSSVFDRSGLFGAAGLRTAWIPTMGKHWSIFTGAFVEYTSKNEIRMGVSVDTSVIAALGIVLLGIALNDNDDDD